MADSNVIHPSIEPARAPKPRPDNTARTTDDEIDAALEAALGKDLDEPTADVSFKRQWDAGLQAELDAALADFDQSNFKPRRPRSRSDRAGKA